jgi:2-desacetyl-2-hydroxyethyl bacteriochlorophyllide A dehydrogenase
MHTRAVVWSAPGEVRMREVEVAEPGPGQVLIENAYSSISPGTERHWLASDESHAVLGTTFPFVPGYAASGQIVAVGPGVDGHAPGDRVVAGPAVGGHASHVLAGVDAVYRVPDELALRKAVFFNLGATAAHTVRLAEVRPGDSLTVVGQGPIGVLATQIARAQGVTPILALDLVGERRALGARLGATHTADPTDEAGFAATLAGIGGVTDAAIDLSASPSGLDVAIRVTRPLGIVAMSTAAMGRVTYDYGTGFVKGLVLKNAFVGARPEEVRRDTIGFLQLVADGVVRTPDRGEETFSPDDAPDVYARVLARDPQLVAPLLAWNPE